MRLMKRFLLQVAVFSVITLAFYAWVLSRANGYTDAFYLRFTSPRQSSLVLGTSRAAQGILPSVLDEKLDKKFYNFSFSILHSPYGPVYLRSIRKKLDEKTRDGIFILAVDPWGISSKTADPNDSTNFREAKVALGNTPFVNTKPNFWYLIKNFDGQYYKILKKTNGNMLLHDDGWLEVTVPMDSAVLATRLAEKIQTYRAENLPAFRYSSLRLDYLKKTIEFLKEHGKVYLVRLPMHPGIFQIEQEFMPDFNQKIGQLVPETSGYYDMTAMNGEFLYTDANHLYKESGKIVSCRIAEWIRTGQYPLDSSCNH